MTNAPIARRRALQGLAAAALLATAPFAHAQSWPTKPIRVVVAFAPGGPADIVARLVAQALQEKLGQQVIVENRGGAGGNIAARLVAKEAPDGYTLLVTTSSMAVNQTLYKDPGFNVQRDFTPIASLAVSPNILVVPPGDPSSNLKEFIQAHKGKSVSYGSAGIGSTPHLTGDQVLRKLGGLEVVHVPYQGAAPALQAAMAGQVQVASVALPPAVPLVKGGKVKALAVTSAKRIEALPDVPTVAESGFPEVVDYTWVGLLGPAKMPPEVVARVNGVVADALRTPEMRQRLAAAGMEPQPGTPANFADYLKSEVAKWAAIIKDIGVEPL